MKNLKKGPKKLPNFKTREEEARFFDTHDMGPYLDQMEDVTDKIELHPDLIRRIRERFRKHLMAIRLEQWQILRAKEIAKRKGVPYQRLMREWISEGIRRENSAGKRRDAQA